MFTIKQRATIAIAFRYYKRGGVPYLLDEIEDYIFEQARKYFNSNIHQVPVEWLWAVTKHYCLRLNELYRMYIHVSAENLYPEILKIEISASIDTDYYEMALAKYDAKALLEIIKSCLDEEEYTIIYLVFMNPKRQDRADIAKELGMSRNKLYRQVKSVRKKLKSHFLSLLNNTGDEQ